MVFFYRKTFSDTLLTMNAKFKTAFNTAKLFKQSEIKFNRQKIDKLLITFPEHTIHISFTDMLKYIKTYHEILMHRIV